MQQRRYRPGDVLDDYCPRERRITDHAIVAMIDDHIKQTRCVVCDAEHEYKDGKVPPQRRKKAQPALFSQVLEGLTGPQPPTRVAPQPAMDAHSDHLSVDNPDMTTFDEDHGEDLNRADAAGDVPDLPMNDAAADVPLADDQRLDHADEDGRDDRLAPRSEEGPWRRQLIRAALPRPEGQPPPQTRPAPDFTVRQPNNARGPRQGHRRAGGGGYAGQGAGGNHAGRFGRGGQGQGQGQGQGGRRRRGRGGKKNN